MIKFVRLTHTQWNGPESPVRSPVLFNIEKIEMIKDNTVVVAGCDYRVDESWSEILEQIRLAA